MNRIRGVVAAMLLAVVWCFPMVSSAKALSAEPTAPTAVVGRGAAAGGTAATPSSGSETSNLEAREQQARELQDFRGGGVTIYIGSGVLFILLIILLIVLL
jgi:hypothetical protein